MKWSRSTPSALSGLLLLTLLVACGDAEPNEAPDDVASDSEVAGEDFSFVQIMPGPVNDFAWVQAHFEGGVAAADEFGIEHLYVENVEPTEDAYIQQGAAFADQGADLVLMVVGTVPGAVTRLAGDFPETWFCIAAIEIPEEELPENGCAYDPQQQIGGFMAGVLAGLTTESDHIGVVGGFTMPAMVRQVEAYFLGARLVNPEIRIEKTYINSLTDASAARTAAQSQIDAGADIIFSVVDQAGQGLIQAARSTENTYVITSYFDASEEAPDVVLASVLYSLESINLDLIGRAVRGELEPTNYLYGAESDVGTLIHSDELADVVSSDAMALLEEIKAQIKSGDIELPSTAELNEDGIGAQIEPQSVYVTG